MVFVHGVDISTLEGWMLKINSNPSMFGKSINRRWFRVGYGGQEHKLIISYSTNKTSREPRGWLYLEDVSGVYCRRDMIEVVSPARTLRFKGETAVEHRLWSDSLHQLCNPPKSSAASSPKTSNRQEPPSDRKAPVPSEREDRSARREDAKASRVREEIKRPDHAEDDAHGRNDRHRQLHSSRYAGEPSSASRRPSLQDQQRPSSDDRSRASSTRRYREESEERERQSSARHAPSARRRHSSSDEEDQDSDCRSDSGTDDRKPAPAAPNERNNNASRRHRINSSDAESSDSDSDHDVTRVVKQQAPSSPVGRRTLEEKIPVKVVTGTPKQPDDLMAKQREEKEQQSQRMEESDEEQEDEEEDREQRAPPKQPAHQHEHDDEQAKQTETTRLHEANAFNLNPKEPSPEKVKMKPKQASEYFDEEEDDDEGSDDEDTFIKRQVRTPSNNDERPTAKYTGGMRDGIARDNNFVDEDWDAEENDGSATSKTNTLPPPKSSPQKRGGYGGVTADTNWVTEDWDD